MKWQSLLCRFWYAVYQQQLLCYHAQQCLKKLVSKWWSFYLKHVWINLSFFRIKSDSQKLLTEDESEFSYDVESETGPLHWGDIKPEWHSCKNGSMQSPIDLLNERVQIVSHLGALQMNYKPSNATLKNRGHDIMVSIN